MTRGLPAGARQVTVHLLRWRRRRRWRRWRGGRSGGGLCRRLVDQESRCNRGGWSGRWGRGRARCVLPAGQKELARRSRPGHRGHHRCKRQKEDVRQLRSYLLGRNRPKLLEHERGKHQHGRVDILCRRLDNSPVLQDENIASMAHGRRRRGFFRCCIVPRWRREQDVALRRGCPRRGERQSLERQQRRRRRTPAHCRARHGRQRSDDVRHPPFFHQCRHESPSR
jgi:hypothetical protein